MAAIFDLNHPAHTVHWHLFTMSAANVAVAGATLVLLVAAIVLPFPGAHRRRRAPRR